MNTWQESSGPSTSILMQAAAMSGSGLFSVAVEKGGKIWLSSNNAVSFAETSSPVLDWTAIKMSHSGQTIVAVSEFHGIYYSLDFGSNWFQSNAPASIWANALAMNDEGDVVVAGLGTGGAIFVSRDYGVSWTVSATSAPKYWHTIACDSTGQYIMAAGDGTAMYLSGDFGTTWTASGGEQYDWQGLALSSSGENAIVFRADKNQDGSTSTVSIYFATRPFAAVATDDNDGGGGDHGGDDDTPSPDVGLIIIVVPCSVGGTALLLLLYFYCCAPGAQQGASFSGRI
jgi:hypothetical protein